MIMKKQALLLGLMLAAAGAAHAQAYVTASVGSSRFNVDCAGTSACDKTGSFGKVIGGYKFGPVLSAEVAYLDFGKTTATVDGLRLAVKASGVGAGVALRGELSGPWTYAARLGLVSMKTTIESSTTGFSDSDSNPTLYGGLGVGYRVTPNFSIDLAMDSSDVKYKKNGFNTSGGVSAFSVGVTLDF